MPKIELPEVTEEITQNLETSEETQSTEETTQKASEETTAVTDDTTVTVSIDGEETQVSLKDLKSGFMRTSDYTKKTQALADGKKQLEGIAVKLQQRDENFTQMLGDPKKLAQFMAATLPADEPIKLADEDVLTVAGMRKMLAAERAQTQAEAAKQAQTVNQNAVLEKMETTAQNAFKVVYAANPKLKNIPHVGDVLKKMALDYSPQTYDEMEAAIVKSGGKLAKDFGLETKPEEKKEVNLLETSGIEPPGGSRMSPKPETDFRRAGGKKVNWAAVDKDVKKFLDSIGGE